MNARYRTIFLSALLGFLGAVPLFGQSEDMVCWPDANQHMIQCLNPDTGAYTPDWVRHHIAIDEQHGTIYTTLHSHNAGNEFLDMPCEPT
jgi:hypothetical protein